MDKKCEKKVFDKSSHEEVCEVKLKSSNTVSCKVNETGSCDSQNYWNSIDSSSLRNVDSYCEKSENLENGFDSTSSSYLANINSYCKGSRLVYYYSSVKITRNANLISQSEKTQKMMLMRVIWLVRYWNLKMKLMNPL